MNNSKTEKEEVQLGKTSLIVALYNFEESLQLLYNSIVESMEKIRGDFELVFIDDGSTDSTYEKLVALAKKDKRIRIVKLRSMFGEAAALDAGLKYSKYDRIVYFSGRVRANTGEIPKFLEMLDEGNDLVVGWRYPRRDSMLNRGISRIFNWLVSRVSKIKLHDINSGIIITYRSVLQKISFYGDLYTFIPVLAKQQGYRVSEKKIEQLSGSFRNSKYPREYLQRFLDIISVFFLSRYSKRPIHFLGFLGSVFVICGFGIEGYLFVYRILQMGPIAGRPLLVLGALLLVVGIQMISIGLLGEMIIFTHAGEIEEYNIEEVVNE